MADDTAHPEAHIEALQEMIDRFEQGETVNVQAFQQLLAEVEARHALAENLPEGDDWADRIRALRSKASALEASAAEGSGPTDGLSSMLAPLTGSDGGPAPT